MKDKKALKKVKEQQILKSLKTIQHPRQTSVTIAIVLFVLLVILAIVAWAVSSWSITSTLLTSSLIGFALILMWILFRLGLFASSRLWFANYRNQKISKGLNAKITKITKLEFQELAKQKSWWGVYFFSGLCGILLLITALITFI